MAGCDSLWQSCVLDGGGVETHLTCSRLSIAALVVRFLTKRFIGDYERNAGEEIHREKACWGGCSHFSVPFKDTSFRVTV